LGYVARFGSNIGVLGKICRFCGRWGCRGDTLKRHFSGRFGAWDKKSRFSGAFLHFGVAATLFKIGFRAIMEA
jgi:hypothetical protein